MKYHILERKHPNGDFQEILCTTEQPYARLIASEFAKHLAIAQDENPPECYWTPIGCKYFTREGTGTIICEEGQLHRLKELRQSRKQAEEQIHGGEYQLHQLQ